MCPAGGFVSPDDRLPMSGTGSQTLLRAPPAAAGILRCCPRLRARLGSGGPRGSRAALASSRGECEPRDATGKVAGALRAASRQRGISEVGLLPGSLSFGKKLLPLFLPALSQARTLPWRGETSLQHELLSRRGSLRGFSLQTGFYPPAEDGGRLPPEALHSTGDFSWALFVGPARGAGELGPSGLERGESPAGASLREDGQRSPSRPAFLASGNNFPGLTTAGTPTKWGTNPSRTRNTKHRLEGSKNCPVCCRSGGSIFFPRREGFCPVPGSKNPSSIPRGPPRAFPRCGPGSARGGGK